MSSIINSFSSYFTHLRGSVQLKLHRRGNKDGPLIFSESIPSVDISNLGHFVIAFFYCAVVIAFSTMVTVQFANRQESSSRTLTPADSLSPLLIDVELSCTNPPNCGSMSFSVSYFGTSRQNDCDVSGMKLFNNGSDTQNVVAVNVPLCYFGEPVFSTYTTGILGVSGVVADFKGINPGYNKSSGTAVWQKNLRALGVVRTFKSGTFSPVDGSSSVNASSNLIRVVNIDSWQVKSLVLSSIVSKATESAISQPDDGIPRAWDVAVQYEGRRPSWRANLVIFHASYGTILTRTRAPDYKFIDVTMEIVGFTFLFTMGLQYLNKPWTWIFPGPGLEKKVEDAEQEKAEELEKEQKHAENLIAEVGDVPIGRSTDDLSKVLGDSSSSSTTSKQNKVENSTIEPSHDDL